LRVSRAERFGDPLPILGWNDLGWKWVYIAGRGRVGAKKIG
jgi:hypothetical protein